MVGSWEALLKTLRRWGLLPKSNGTPTRAPGLDGVLPKTIFLSPPFGAGVSSPDAFLGLTPQASVPDMGCL